MNVDRNIQLDQMDGFTDLKNKEKEWQCNTGNELIEKSYSLAGSRLVYENQFKKIIGKIKFSNSASLLEIGCGRGQLINTIANKFGQRGFKFYALDLSLKLNDLKQKYNTKIHWLVSDGESLPFLSGSLDIVICNGSLHHMANFPKALDEIFRVLCPSGQIILFEPVSTAFSRMLHRIFDPFIFKKVKYESPVDEVCKNNFQLKKIQKIINDAGYKYTQSWHDFLAYPLTGCYAGSFFSNKPVFMKYMIALEDYMQKVPILRKLCSVISWRILIDIHNN